jgi:hypothetical protein
MPTGLSKYQTISFGTLEDHDVNTFFFLKYKVLFGRKIVLFRAGPTFSGTIRALSMY